MPKTILNGLSFYYEVHGQGEPLLLSAGLSCGTNHWANILKQLSERFTVIIYDNRGVGQSDAPDSAYTIELMTLDVCALLNYLQIPAAHILGHSMGGCIAQQMALTFPHRVKKLVLSNTLLRMNAVSRMAQLSLLHMKESNVAAEMQVEALLPWIFSNEFLSQPEKVGLLAEQILNNPFPQTLIGLKRQLDALLDFDSSSWCHKIKAPTLIIAGAEDVLCPSDSERLFRYLPHARFVNMFGTAHVPMIEKPCDFTQIVVRFLLTKNL